MFFTFFAAVFLLVEGPAFSQQQACLPTCLNGGTCVATDTCTCDTGWQGNDCGTAICTTACQNSGTCTAPDTCTCTSQWTGSDCATPICTRSCANGAICTGYNNCTNCPAGWTGVFCDVAICTPPCNPINSQCTSPNVCTCLKGFLATNATDCSTPDGDLLTGFNDHIPEFSYVNDGNYAANWITQQFFWTGAFLQPNNAIRYATTAANSRGNFQNRNHFPLTEFSINATLEYYNYGFENDWFQVYAVSSASRHTGNCFLDSSKFAGFATYTGTMYHYTEAIMSADFINGTSNTNYLKNYFDPTTQLLHSRFRLGIVVKEGGAGVQVDVCNTTLCQVIFRASNFSAGLPVANTSYTTVVGISAGHGPELSEAYLIDFRVYTLSTCTRTCQHGFCYKTGDYCYCRTGWTGPDCSMGICATPCGTNKQCSAPNTCTCQSGWAGANCTIPSCTNCNNKGDYCLAPNICKQVEKPEWARFYLPDNCGRNFRLIAADRFQQLSGVTLQQCTRACRQAGEFKCRSLSYYPNATNTQCWLNVGHTNELWEGLEPAPGWLYYHVETYGETPVCKINTYRDCSIVNRLGLGPGNYTFQTEIGSTPFTAECIYLPSGYTVKWGSNATNASDLSMVFHKRSRFNDINYNNKTYQDYKWGFRSSTNTTNWVGLEWAYRLTSDFALVPTAYPTWCIELAALNTTTTYLVLRNENKTTASKNCAYFTNRQGNLMVATRSTCLCQDPSSSYIVTCGCNILQARKFLFPNVADNLLYEHYRPPFSDGTRRWVSTNPPTNGVPVTSEIATSTGYGWSWAARSMRWNIILLYETSAGVLHGIFQPKAVIDSEANGYRIYIPTYGNLSGFDLLPSVGSGFNAYNTPFITSDRPAGSVTYGGGFWMVNSFKTYPQGWQVCFTCTAETGVYGYQNFSMGYDGRSYVLLTARQEGA